MSAAHDAAMSDVCLLIEGGYPYLLGGVSSWTDAFIRAFPERSFSVVALITADQERVRRFEPPPNLVSVTDLLLDRSPAGGLGLGAGARIAQVSASLRAVLTDGGGAAWSALIRDLEETGFGERALLNSRHAWRAMERIYEETLPGAPLVDFFWTWRVLVKGLLAIATAPVPPARIYHAVSTGYAGLLGARARCLTGRPLVVTEHGIYTNERRIELSIADWIYDSAACGFDAAGRAPELRKIWLRAFGAMSRIAYDTATCITTQYRTNQEYQIQDGAELGKLRMIPNGIDVDQFPEVPAPAEPRRPTVLLVGRIVPIKDIRTFILAMGILRQSVPDLDALIIGPDDEDRAYAAECRNLVQQLKLQGSVRFLGRVRDVKEHFALTDVLVLTSISEAQPLALLEAGAAGVPAVATDVGSCREIIEGGDASEEPGGFVVRACDPPATAAALAEILLQPDLRARMGRAMRERVRRIYNQPRITRMYNELYDSLGAPEAVGGRAEARGAAAWPA
ncbi:GT4 family glycosyltransferase PelF [Methylobacterium soli]|uniref:DUF3492 domain-containing protein n=1 Tax=Methylobacterium soli TaxID=553447 RepID=A0A6L3T2U0_9HYPH|nr:GT4 family glycosyltransferase PelF [Methylobacterium soli]KAB1080271.1 DUF3492 domain-containing protein [Methylobacterium soli]GJE42607.1 D-inositol-3-phosphate glycosyltransferase [Methylobacterium soli]